MKHLKITIFLFFKDASPLARTPLFDKALETLYPMLKTEQQHELDVFRHRRKESLLKRFGSPTP